MTGTMWVRSLYEKGAQVNIMDLKNYWKPGLEGDSAKCKCFQAE